MEGDAVCVSKRARKDGIMTNSTYYVIHNNNIFIRSYTSSWIHKILKGGVWGFYFRD